MEFEKYDVIIIGAGVAGLSSAGYAARSCLKTLVLGVGGGQVQNIRDLENYPGVYPPVSGSEFIETLKKQASAFGAEIRNSRVETVDKINNIFVVHTASGAVVSDALILATGAVPRKLDVPGEDYFAGRGVSYCAACDGPFFKNKRIAVIGGGDAACDEAIILADYASSVTVIHRKSRFRAQKAIAERVLKNNRIEVKFNTVVQEITGIAVVEALRLKNMVTGEESLFSVDGVFIFVGTIPVTDLMPVLKHDEKGFVLTDEHMSVGVPGLFCAGDVRAKPFRQVVTAAADGAVAAHSAAAYIRGIRDGVYI